MRLRMQPRSVAVDKMAGIFAKRLWHSGNPSLILYSFLACTTKNDISRFANVTKTHFVKGLQIF